MHWISTCLYCHTLLLERLYVSQFVWLRCSNLLSIFVKCSSTVRTLFFLLLFTTCSSLLLFLSRFIWIVLHSASLLLIFIPYVWNTIYTKLSTFFFLFRLVVCKPSLVQRSTDTQSTYYMRYIIYSYSRSHTLC